MAPFLEHDARTFSAELGGDFEIVPLHIPRRPEPWMVTVASGEGSRLGSDVLRVVVRRLIAPMQFGIPFAFPGNEHRGAVDDARTPTWTRAR
jgi:hypothetical protein